MGEWDPRPLRERTRSRIALALVIALIGLAFYIIWLTAHHKITVGDAKDLGLVVFSPLVAITATALGFFFGGGGSRDEDK